MEVSGICYIIGAGEFTDSHFTPNTTDYIIAADGGLKYLEEREMKPDLVVGDFDSYGKVPDCANLIRHPVKKDDTDLELAMEKAYEKGYRNYRLYGVCGGRVDHTIANIQMASGYADLGCNLYLFGNGYTCLVTGGEQICFPDDYQGTVSIFSLAAETQGVTLQGLEYPLENYLLKNTDPIGVSNAFQQEEARIFIKTGKLLILWYGNDDSKLPEVAGKAV